MIVVKLLGGLGNQMFQYAAARGTGDRHIYFDPSFIDHHKSDNEQFTSREFELGIFPELIGINFSLYQQRLFNSEKSIDKILRNILYGKMVTVKQIGNGSVAIPKSKGLVLHGFFQSENYFKPMRNELLHEFKFPALDQKNRKLAEHISMLENPISVHVRRGDYLKPKVNEYHGILPITYYRNAVSILEQSLSGSTYIIFSDDLGWCEENLIRDIPNSIFVKGNTGKEAWKDMCLMTLCKHHVIANSSFSWWGAWLSVLNGITLAPYRWFNPTGVEYNIHDFVPEDWRIVDYD